MDNLIKLTNDSFKNYFNALKYSGYVNSTDTNNLLILSFLEELLFNNYYYITEEEYNVIRKALLKLYGNNCIIKFPEYDAYSEIMHKTYTDASIRISEINKHRYSENNTVRTAV